MAASREPKFKWKYYTYHKVSDHTHTHTLTPNYVYTFQVAAVGTSQKIGPFSNPVNTSLPGEIDC